MVSWGGLASASSSDAVGPIQSNSPITWGANHAYLHALPCSRLLIYWMSREIFRPYHQPPAQRLNCIQAPLIFNTIRFLPRQSCWQCRLCCSHSHRSALAANVGLCNSHTQWCSRGEARLQQCRGGADADRSVLLSSSSTLKAARAYLSWRASVPFWLGQENSDSQTGRPYLEYTSFKNLHSGSAQPGGVSW